MYDNESVFSKHKNDLGRCDVVQHEIHLRDKVPVYIKQFKVPEVHSTSIEDQVKEWLKLDIVQPSMSRYNSPIFVVKKKDDNFRLVQDFRALNAKTYPDRYSMRDVMEAAMKGIPNVLVYIDDILKHSNTHEEHRQILRQFFQRLKRFNLKIHLEKCHFVHW